MKTVNSIFRFFYTILPVAFTACGFSSYAQTITLYQQNFDNPAPGSGDIGFSTSPIYNGLTTPPANGFSTGASFSGSSVIKDGVIATSFGSIKPQSGKYLLEEQTNVSGTTTYNGIVYSSAGTNISLLPNSTYRLTYYIGSRNNLNEPSIQASINGVALGPAVQPSQVGVLQLQSYLYQSGTNTAAVIALNNNTVTGYGNDLAVDSIQFVLLQGTLPLTGLTPNQTAIAQNLGSGPLNGISIPLYVSSLADPSSMAGNLNELSPEQFSRFTSITAFNNASFETEAMDNYLATQRQGPQGAFASGDGSIDVQGLTFHDSNEDPSLTSLHSRLLAFDPPAPDGLVRDAAAPEMGVMEKNDNKDLSALAAPDSLTPWNVFIRGNLILGQSYSQKDFSHFDENTESVIVGADYRLTPNFLLGVKAGYGHTDVTLDSAGSSATIDSYTSGLYASYASQGWYANVTGDYLHHAYTQSRVISFLGQTARSAPQGNEGVANLDGGYEFNRGALTLGPVAGLQYTHLSVDGYSENGSVADLSVAEDQADSLRSRLGGRVSYALSWQGTTLTPHLDATWQHEFMDQNRGITSQFATTGLGNFTVETDKPGRDYALMDLGINADLNQTVTLFANYAVQAGQENYFGQSVQAGVKICF